MQTIKKQHHLKSSKTVKVWQEGKCHRLLWRLREVFSEEVIFEPDVEIKVKVNEEKKKERYSKTLCDVQKPRDIKERGILRFTKNSGKVTNKWMKGYVGNRCSKYNQWQILTGLIWQAEEFGVTS